MTSPLYFDYNAAILAAASLGSARHEKTDDDDSGVLGAMGVGAGRAAGAVRLSIGEPTTDDEIHHAADALIESWRTLSFDINRP
ncbi:MAG: hypothetical protein KDI47_11350 [Gammaproteobacteria bacterium]|nr:hypothetical protein [Gammaproteobacteria bacterium]MCP5407686.1 hypothetical protein [Chromatiaceae bacterium]